MMKRSRRSMSPMSSAADQPRCRQEPRMPDHPMVGPHGLPFDMPGPLQDLDGLREGERACHELLVELRDLPHRRKVGDENAAVAQRALCVLHDSPWFGQVEHDAIEV